MNLLKRSLLPRLWPFAAYLLCTYLLLRDPYNLAGSEFSGGWLTGRLREANAFGFFLFVGTAMLARIPPRFRGSRYHCLFDLLASLSLLHFSASVSFHFSRRVVSSVGPTILRARQMGY
jgi:hypothetical protein